MPQNEFYGLMKIVDEFELFLLTEKYTAEVQPLLAQHPLISEDDLSRLGSGVSIEQLGSEIAGGALPIFDGKDLVGCIRSGNEEDENLTPGILLENLATKASGVLALRYVLHLFAFDPGSIDYVMNCGEEGVGDRYQRGAGNLAKAMAELSWCQNSSGADIKAFCCSPVHAIVLAASLVQSGVFNAVAVVGGGSLAKLGMKMRGHLAHSMPILEDVLAGIAIVIGRDDGYNPRIRLDSVGKHDVACSSAPQAIMESLVLKPLDRLGLKITDIDKYATEMHDPEITEAAGSGNVPHNNYRMIGGLAVMRKWLNRTDLDSFEKRYGMPGFSPTQGHIASAVPFLGHAREAILRGEIKNTMFLAKGSLFLAKMTKLSDGMSFILEETKAEETTS